MKSVKRFPRRENMTVHVALFTRMISGPNNFFEHLSPIFHGLIVRLHNYVLNDRWSDPFVVQGEVNRPILQQWSRSLRRIGWPRASPSPPAWRRWYRPRAECRHGS